MSDLICTGDGVATEGQKNAPPTNPQRRAVRLPLRRSTVFGLKLQRRCGNRASAGRRSTGGAGSDVGFRTASTPRGQLRHPNSRALVRGRNRHRPVRREEIPSSFPLEESDRSEPLTKVFGTHDCVRARDRRTVWAPPRSRVGTLSSEERRFVSADLRRTSQNRSRCASPTGHYGPTYIRWRRAKGKWRDILGNVHMEWLAGVVLVLFALARLTSTRQTARTAPEYATDLTRWYRAWAGDSSLHPATAVELLLAAHCSTTDAFGRHGSADAPRQAPLNDGQGLSAVRKGRPLRPH